MKLLGKYLNPEEIAVGALHAAVWIGFLKLWGILTIPLVALLWAWGGADGTSKNWRRLGAPIVLCLLLAIAKLSWLPLISILPCFGILTIGYGIPSFHNDGSIEDEGSFLGKIIYKKVKGDMIGPDKLAERASTMIVRAILALLFAIALLPLAWISILPWAIGTIALTFLVPTAVDII